MKRRKRAALFVLPAIAGAAIVGFASRDLVVSHLKTALERHRDDRRRRADYERWSAERTTAERERERTWQAGPMTPCASFGRGAAPQVCIEHLGPDTARIGTPVAYRVRWRNLPEGGYIRVWSRNAAPAGERWRYMGPQGAIAPQPLGGSNDGDVRVTWDGRGVYCAPADFPMMCDAGEVGRYVLRAAIMTGSDPFWPSWPLRDPVPLVRHAQSETQPFALDGPPQPVSRPGSFREYPAEQAIVRAIRQALPAGALGSDRYVRRRIDRLGPWTRVGARYCARLALDRPLIGSADVCFPRSRRDTNGIALEPGDITATSDAEMADGLMRADDAKAKATAYAVRMTGGRATFTAYPSEDEMVRALYPDPSAYKGDYQVLRDAARDAGLTYVEVDQPDVSFRDDPGGSWWLVTFRLRIDTIDGPQVADWGRVTLRVDHDSHVCRVAPTSDRDGAEKHRMYSGCLAGSRRRM
jgi:hypothetical protein